jgi:N-acetylneuraminate synthase/N,N'-diacetyllegionaminate synthase
MTVARAAVHIGEREIGSGRVAFIIAEAGVNHNGDVKLAKQLIDVAVAAGADAVKFQTFKAEQVVSSLAPKAQYQLDTTDVDESPLEMLQRLELSCEASRHLRDYCQERDIIFLSTPFDRGSADFLEQLGVPAFKIGSGEITNWPLLEHVASKGKTIVLSTGMSYLSEVGEAVRVIQDTGNDQLVLLHCVSNYPAAPACANLRAIGTMAVAFQVPVGFSDHTPGIEVSLAAVAMGACMVEKHFTLDKNLPGPDHRASLDPHELKALVRGIRIVESASGDGVKRPAQSERDNRELVRRSLAAGCDIPAGTILTSELLESLRPASGISPTLRQQVVGRKTRRSLAVGQLIEWEDLA